MILLFSPSIYLLPALADFFSGPQGDWRWCTVRLVRGQHSEADSISEDWATGFELESTERRRRLLCQACPETQTSPYRNHGTTFVSAEVGSLRNTVKWHVSGTGHVRPQSECSTAVSSNIIKTLIEGICFRRILFIHPNTGGTTPYSDSFALQTADYQVWCWKSSFPNEDFLELWPKKWPWNRHHSIRF